MAFETLKTLINDNIKSGLPNGIRPEEEHNPVLQSIVSTFGQDYIYMGLATTSTSPSTDDNARMYITNGGGTYTNFMDDESNPIVVEEGSICFLKGVSGTYSKDVIIDGGSITDSTKLRISDSGTALDLEAYHNSAWVSIGKFSYDGTEATYEDLTANSIVSSSLDASSIASDSITSDTMTINGATPVSLKGLAGGMSITKQRQEQVGGDKIVNTAANSLAELSDAGILGKAALVYAPFTSRADYTDSLVPSHDYGRFDFARSSSKNVVNKDGLLNYLPEDVPAYEYDNGVEPYLLTEPASTNLITYPISFGNSYWTKSGASIEGDSSTAGSELVTDGVFADPLNTNWTTNGDWTIAGGSGAVFTYTTSLKYITQTFIIADNAFIQLTFTISGASGGGASIKFTNEATNLLFGGAYTPLYPDGTYTLYYNTLEAATGIRIYANTNSFTIDNVSVKELQGFESPKVDGSGDLETEAYKLVEDGATSSHRIASSSLAFNASDYSQFIYAKAGERDVIQIFLGGQHSGSAYANFDLTNGTIPNSTGLTPTIIPMADGWYKCSVVFTASASGGEVIYYSLADSDAMARAGSYAGDGTSGIYVAYAQLEEQASATSLMLPAVEGSTSSRVADVVNNGGSQALFGGVNASGVLYTEIAALSDDLTDRYITIGDGTTDNYVDIYYSSASNLISTRVYSGGVIQFITSTSVNDISDFHKIAVRWAQDDFSLWVDSIEIATDTSGITPLGLNTLKLSYPVGSSSAFYGKTKGVAVFNYLSDTEMTKLTTV